MTSSSSSSSSIQSRSPNFTLLGHSDLGAADTNGDVCVHGDYAYGGTWRRSLHGGGVVDVSELFRRGGNFYALLATPFSETPEVYVAMAPM